MRTQKMASILSAAAAVTLASAAVAQTPTFSLPTNVVAQPGSTVSVPLTLAGGPDDTAAVNITIRVPAAQSALIAGNLSADPATAPANMIFQDNNLTWNDGGQTGKEYRLVLYAQSTPVETFDSSTSARVIDLRIPISADAKVGTTISLLIPAGSSGFENRNGATIGLLGVSNSVGVSIVADSNGDSVRNPATDRPLASPGSLIVGYNGFPTEYDAVPSGTIAGWEYNQFVPFRGPDGIEVTGQAVTGQGFRITLAQTAGVETNPFRVLFGAYTSPFAFGTATAGLVDPPVGTLLRSEWLVSSSATSRTQSPILRSRFTSADVSRSTEAVYQGPFETADGPTVPLAGAKKTLTNWALVTDNVKNGGFPADPNGFNVAFDTYYTGGFGSAGTAITLEKATFSLVNPASLTGATTVYERNFTTQGNGEWIQGNLPTTDAVPVTYSQDSNGLGIRTGGPPSDPTPGTNERFRISFGFFDTRDSQIMTVDSSKVYRATYVLGTDATDRSKVPTVRFRYLVQNTFDYATATVTGNVGSENSASPIAGTDRTFVTYNTFPPEANGKPVTVAFDVYRDSASLGDHTVYLRSVKIEALNP
jgi:hypothetical protein